MGCYADSEDVLRCFAEDKGRDRRCSSNEDCSRKEYCLMEPDEATLLHDSRGVKGEGRCEELCKPERRMGCYAGDGALSFDGSLLGEAFFQYGVTEDAEYGILASVVGVAVCAAAIAVVIVKRRRSMESGVFAALNGTERGCRDNDVESASIAFVALNGGKAEDDRQLLRPVLPITEL